MKSAILFIIILFNFKVFDAIPRLCILHDFQHNRIRLTCMEHDSHDTVSMPPQLSPLPTLEYNKSKSEPGCDNRPTCYHSKECKKQLLQKYAKMYNILEKLKLHVRELESNKLANDHSIHDRISNLDTNSDIRPSRIKSGGLMKDFEGYFFTDW